MAGIKIDPMKYPIRMEGSYPDEGLALIGATVAEGLSELTCITAEFVCSNRALKLEDIVGKKMRVVMDPPTGPKRVFPGTCVSVEYLGADRGPGHFCAEIRPWLWFLTRTRECRVFQDKTVPDIIRQILGDYGFSSDLDDLLTGSYETREYLVQYRETDFDFLSRLMEEVGIYYFFTEKDNREKMVLLDDLGAHKTVTGTAKIPFISRGSDVTRQEPHIFDWTSAERAVSGKVTLADYDFTRPTADMKSVKEMPSGVHTLNDREIYDYPGHYRNTAVGNNRARVRMQAEAVRHKTASGQGNITNLGVGLTFTLDGHPRKADDVKHLVTQAVHRLVLTGTDLPAVRPNGPLHGALAQMAKGPDPYEVSFRTIPASEQFRAPLKTPWPEIAGVHTARVVGPSGEDIFTDEYGRIKVQFHWDRLGKKDDKSSCFVRTMMPWTGKNWGMIAIPRIGQEVVIHFEEGNPDRPIAIGMLYNADTMPPYELPGNMTQSGIKTNSSKGGGGFNELMFEDKKDSELVRFQSERDYQQIVKNDAKITVGLEHKDKGDMDVTVHRHLTETLDTGDHTFKIAEGSQKIDIKKDKKETIEGKSDLTVTGNVSQTVKTGNVSQTVKTGNVTVSIDKGNLSEAIKMGNAERTLDMGNEKTTLKLGNRTVDVKLGKIDEKAMQGITLTCGGSSIKIDPMGVTIKGPMIKIEASGILQAKGAMTQIQSQLLILKGSMTMIN
jgi:type VI secretion system secreted protein VgrG